MLTRRTFLAAGGSAFVAGAANSFGADEPRKRVAFLGTAVYRHSHAQHFLDRLTQGYIWGGRWQQPRVQVASVYLDQFPSNDLGKQRIKRHGLRQCGSIGEALTLGGSELAVDGVVLIGEHGDYPRNEKGQKLYPRYRWFKEVVKVFEKMGKSVPVFNDKHLSTSWDECTEMAADAERLKFAFLAGSSLPVTWRLPSIDMPYGAALKESVCVAYGGVDSYDFHALETAQCMSERREGGEVGVKHVQVLKGENLWQRLGERERTQQLFLSALCRSHNLPVEGGYPTEPVSFKWARQNLPGTIGYFIEHRDGFRTSIYLTRIRDFNYAGYLESGKILSCQMYLPMPGHGSTTADFFNPLTRHIEDMVLTGRAPYPVQRTLLTSGLVIAGVDSLHQDQKLVQTPHLNVAYQAPKESQFWRA